MKLIIAGGRNVTEVSDYGAKEVQAFIDFYKLTDVTEVVSGTAKGADQLGELWAEVAGVPVKQFPANWEYYGRGAGHIRNKQMADYADALMIIWDGKSRGSRNMKETMIKLNKPFYEILL